MNKKYIIVVLTSFFFLSVHNKGQAIKGLDQYQELHYAGCIFGLAELLKVATIKTSIEKPFDIVVRATKLNAYMRLESPSYKCAKSFIASLVVVGTSRYISDKTPVKIATEKFNNAFSGSPLRILLGDVLKSCAQIICTRGLLKFTFSKDT